MNSKDIFDSLLSRLWEQYCKRVPYAASYAKMVKEKGGNVINDHMAFRTFNTNTGMQPAGVEAISRLFIAFGYEQKEKYIFASKHLTAWHYEHKQNPDNPKIFISQLEVNELPEQAVKLINETVEHAVDPLTSTDKELLEAIKAGEELDEQTSTALLDSLYSFFARPWQAPKKSVVLDVDKVSQYAAWTLLHGNSVNHFTAYINKQNVKEWSDLEDTVNALRAAGIPMKDKFEGEKGSKLRQSSTKAVMEQSEIIEYNGQHGKIDWTYAYYELAERGMVDGKVFTGFLGDQATNLFEMTKKQ